MGSKDLRFREDLYRDTSFHIDLKMQSAVHEAYLMIIRMENGSQKKCRTDGGLESIQEVFCLYSEKNYKCIK